MTYFLYNNSWNGNRLLVYLQKNMFEHVFWNILKKEFENRDSSAARHLVRRGLQLNDGKALHIRPKKHKKLSLNLICRMTWAEALRCLNDRLNAVLTLSQKGRSSLKMTMSIDAKHHANSNCFFEFVKILLEHL